MSRRTRRRITLFLQVLLLVIDVYELAGRMRQARDEPGPRTDDDDKGQA